MLLDPEYGCQPNVDYSLCSFAKARTICFLERLKKHSVYFYLNFAGSKILPTSTVTQHSHSFKTNSNFKTDSTFSKTETTTEIPSGPTLSLGAIVGIIIATIIVFGFICLILSIRQNSKLIQFSSLINRLIIFFMENQTAFHLCAFNKKFKNLIIGNN